MANRHKGNKVSLNPNINKIISYTQNSNFLIYANKRTFQLKKAPSSPTTMLKKITNIMPSYESEQSLA